jgi:hypothetical protein
MTDGITIILGCIQIFIIGYHHSEKLFGCSASFQLLKHSKIHSNLYIIILKALESLVSKHLRIIDLDIILWIDKPNILALSVF